MRNFLVAIILLFFCDMGFADDLDSLMADVLGEEPQVEESATKEDSAQEPHTESSLLQDQTSAVSDASNDEEVKKNIDEKHEEVTEKESEAVVVPIASDTSSEPIVELEGESKPLLEKKSEKNFYDGKISKVIGEKIIVDFFSKKSKEGKYYYVYDPSGKLKGKVVLSGVYGKKDLVKPVKTDVLKTGWFLRSKLKADYEVKLKKTREQLEQTKKKMVEQFKVEQKNMKARFKKKSHALKEAEVKRLEREIAEMRKNVKVRKKSLSLDMRSRVKKVKKQEAQIVSEKVKKEEDFLRRKMQIEMDKEETQRRAKLIQQLKDEESAKKISLQSSMDEERKKRLIEIEEDAKEMEARLSEYKNYLEEKKRALAQAQNKVEESNEAPVAKDAEAVEKINSQETKALPPQSVQQDSQSK